MWAACCGFVQSKTKLQGVIRPAVAGFQASQGFEIYFMHLLGCVCGGFYYFFFSSCFVFSYIYVLDV